ncbi:MAG: exo-alpha-sialidase, partial [Geobacter sp.]
MKSIYKIFLLALGVYTSAFSQITEITRLPVQDISQSNHTAQRKTKRFVSISILFSIVMIVQVFAQTEPIKDFPRAYESQEINNLTPVWISDNEILILYQNSTYDTIFSRRTTNLGNTWSQQKVEQTIDVPDPYFSDMYLYKTLNGRLLLFWKLNISSINCSYSDNNGIDWINLPPLVISSLPIDFSVVEPEPRLIVLSFSSPIRWLTRLSTDNGETWTENTYYKPPSRIGWRYRNPHFIKLSASGDSVLAIYSSNYSIIYTQLSTDRGNNWSDTTRIMDTRLGLVDPADFLSIKTVRDNDENIWLVYDRKYDLGI